LLQGALLFSALWEEEDLWRVNKAEIEHSQKNNENTISQMILSPILAIESYRTRYNVPYQKAEERKYGK
jgi:hypothetical protein